MKENVQLRAWLADSLNRRVLYPLSIVLAVVFAIDIWFSISSALAETKFLAELFLNQQRGTLQLYDYTRVSDQLASFFKARGMKFVEVVTDTDVVIASYVPENGDNLQSLLRQNSSTLIWQHGRPYVVVAAELSLSQGGQDFRLNSVVPLLSLLAPSMLRALAMAFLLVGIVYTVRRSIGNSAVVVSRTIEEFADQASNIRTSQDVIRAPVLPGGFKILEFDDLTSSFRSLLANLHKHEGQVAEASRHKALADLAASVAHDIRSPLSALNMVVGSASQISEEKKLLLTAAASRINEIAEDLLKVHRNEKTVNAQRPIGTLIVDLVEEKRIQIPSSIKIVLDVQVGQLALPYKTAGDLQRMLSNLMDNAVDAIGSNGELRIMVRRESGRVHVEIGDNGRGIPPEVLAKLGREKVTFGRPSGRGNGLGLFNAFRSVQNLGGEIRIVSQLGSGTTVAFELPIAAFASGDL